MAQKTVVTLIDDIDGERADETVRFGLDGLSYEIDLRTANADKLWAIFQPLQTASRKVGGVSLRGRTAMALAARVRIATGQRRSAPGPNSMGCR